MPRFQSWRWGLAQGYFRWPPSVEQELYRPDGGEGNERRHSGASFTCPGGNPNLPNTLKTRRSTVGLGLSLLTFLSLAAPQATADPMFTVLDLGTLGGTS